MTHARFLKQAIDLAAQSVRDGSSPFGCVIADRGGRIVGQGCNRVVPDNDPTAHGEIVAIRDACRNLGSFDLSGCVLYSSCEPCPMCLNAIKWANIRKAYYAATRNDADAVGFRDRVFYETDPVALRRIDMPEARRIMDAWATSKKKKTY